MMRRLWLQGVLLFSGVVVAASTAASGQTDVALSVYGSFPGTTNGNGTVQSPSNSAGGIVELRHIKNPLMGFEATYSYNRADQTYSHEPGTGTCVVGLPCTPETVKANAHEITGDYLVSVHIANLRPFVL